MRANFERRVPIVMVFVGSSETDGERGLYVVIEGAVSSDGLVWASMFAIELESLW
jgi:hypothetical protein